MTKREWQHIVERLRAEKCSCIVCKDGQAEAYYGRGVADLYRLLTEEPEVLREAAVADKVVGKGAAALMISGGVREVYAEVISRPALALLREAGVRVEYARCVPHIINRRGDGPCPVEALCRDCRTAAECLPAIRGFMEEMNCQNKSPRRGTGAEADTASLVPA